MHYDIAKIATLIGGTRHDVDAAFSDRAGRAIPVHFSVTIPEPSDVTPLVDEAPEGAIVKFSFVTKSAEPRLIENLFFVEATVAPAPESDRLRALGGYLSDTIFAQATAGFAEPKKVAIRRVQVGSFPAAELSGSYIDPALGPVNLRLLAIPDPDSDRAVIVVNNGVAKLLPLTDPDQLANTFAGRTLSTFRFLPQN